MSPYYKIWLTTLAYSMCDLVLNYLLVCLFQLELMWRLGS